MKEWNKWLWDLVYMVVIFAFVMLPYSFADTLQLSPQECINAGNSAGNIADARLHGRNLEDTYKFYDEHLNIAKDKLDHRNKLIYSFVKNQIKVIYEIPNAEIKSIKNSPQAIAERFYNACLGVQGRFVLTDETGM